MEFHTLLEVNICPLHILLSFLTVNRLCARREFFVRVRTRASACVPACGARVAVCMCVRVRVTLWHTYCMC
jgi:hypothetical protein